MVTNASKKAGGPGSRIPARFFIASALLVSGSAAWTQARPQPARPPAQQPRAAAPDVLITMKLVWSALAALDHANQTGNYSVLRDLGAPSFQAANSAATLGGIFQALRSQRVDVANTLIVSPTFDFAPAMTQAGLLRVRGRFPLRPTAIGFDLLFENVGGQWRIFGMAVVPLAQQSPRAPASSR